MERWLKDESRPSTRMLPIFRSALDGIVDKLKAHEEKWAFGGKLAPLIHGEEPKFQEQVVPNEAAKVRKWLRNQLEKPMRTTRLFQRAEEVDFPRAKVYYAAKQLGVIKSQKGAGRGSYSVWSLP